MQQADTQQQSLFDTKAPDSEQENQPEPGPEPAPPTDQQPSYYHPDDLKDNPPTTGDEDDPQLALKARVYNPAAEFAAKTILRRQLDAQSKSLGAELEQLQPMVVDQLNDLNLQRMTTKDGYTVHLEMDRRPSLVTDENGSKDAAHQALKDAGLDYLVLEGVNANSLRGYINDLKKRKQELPLELAQFININERPRVGVRSS